jgi:GNAT superfamily N-acetyltransferase
VRRFCGRNPVALPPVNILESLRDTKRAPSVPSSRRWIAMIFREFLPGSPEHHEALKLRELILRAPLGLDFTEDELALESACFHIGGFDGGRLVAVLLLKPLDDRTAKMRQVAVSDSLQGLGIGAGMVAYAEEFARERGFTEVIAHARGTALGFYRKLGYSIRGEPFLETTIPHQLVAKALDAGA